MDRAMCWTHTIPFRIASPPLWSRHCCWKRIKVLPNLEMPANTRGRSSAPLIPPWRAVFLPTVLLFSRIPLKQRVKRRFARAFRVCGGRNLPCLKAGAGRLRTGYFSRVAERCAMLKEAAEALAAQFPDVDLYEIMTAPA